MEYRSACVVLCAIFAVCSAASYEYIPGIEYEGEIYVPLEIVSGVRVARSPYGRRQHGNRPRYNEGGYGGNGGYGGSGAQATAESSAISQQGDGFAFPGGNQYSPVAYREPLGGHNTFGPGGQQGTGLSHAAGTAIGTDASSNSNTQSFSGKDYSAQSASSSATAHSNPGFYDPATLAVAKSESGTAS